MSTIKHFILGIILTLVSINVNASVDAKPMSTVAAKAYNKVETYILEAERKTGESAELLSTIMFMESDFGHNNNNLNGSNAQGAMQHMPGRWAEDVKKHAKTLGVSAKNAVRSNKRSSILIGAAGLADNRAVLDASTSKLITDGDVYMSWRIGLYGAKKIINAKDNTPISKLVTITKGNRSLYMVNGKIATVKQFREKMNQRVKSHQKEVMILVNQTRMNDLIQQISGDPIYVAKR